MFTLGAYSESQDSAVLTEILPVPDQHLTIAGDEIAVPDLNQLLGYYFFGADFTQGQLNSPSLRALLAIDVEPADLVDEPGSPPNVHDLFEKPVPLEPEEGLRAYMAEDNVAASRVNALVWLGEGPVVPVKEPHHTVMATGSTALVLNTWTAVPLTFSQSLPSGGYEILGARFQSTGCQAGRLIIPGHSWRPGCPGVDTDDDLDHPRFRHGEAGVWATFKHNAPPQAEMLSAVADAAEIVHLDIRKVA